MTKIENLPAELRETGLFCCWRYEQRGDKRTKVPFNPRTGGRAQSTNPDTFAPLPVAAKAAEHYDGLGVGVFGNLGAIDIDHCVDENSGLSDMAADVIEIMQGYTEDSPSGRGLRILFKATDFQYDKTRYYINNQQAGLEVYIAGCTNKFVTVTGNAWFPGRDLEERGEELAVVLEKYMVRPQAKAQPTSPAELDDQALIEKARASKNGAQFAALWSGDVSGYASHSEADMALCNWLAWWTNRDAQRVDRLFRQSGLMREKWDRRQSGSTYGAITVQNAVAAVRQGYNPQALSGEKRGFEQLMGKGAFATFATFATDSQEWENPVPFDEINTPDFPTERLPGTLASFVESIAESTQTPEEMAGILSLGVLATAFQSKFTVEITPDWKEPLCLYCVAVAPPGERKTAVISALTKPIYEYEAEQREIEAVEIVQNQTERALLEKALEAAKNSATKGKGNFAEKRAEAMELSAQLAQFKAMHPFRLLADDTTPEKLVDLMDIQGGSITVCSAEGGIFDSMAGRYEKGANFDVYLKGHSGDMIVVDRIGRRTNSIPNPRLTMLLTIQPEVLSGLMENTTFRGRGLCGRFLYAMCKSKVGHREISPAPMPDSVRVEYRAFIRRILSSQWSGTIQLSPEADEIRRKYQGYIEKKLGDEWECMRDWGGKLTGAMVRIAALMHAAEVQGNPTETPISPEVMAGATSIAEFLSAHAVAAYQIMGADEEYENARYLWRRICSAGQEEMSKRDLFNICKGKFKRVEDMEPTLQTLVDMGYVREVEEATGGRPTKKLIVNPKSKSSKSSKREAGKTWFA